MGTIKFFVCISSYLSARRLGLIRYLAASKLNTVSFVPHLIYSCQVSTPVSKFGLECANGFQILLPFSESCCSYGWIIHSIGSALSVEIHNFVFAIFLNLIS